MNILYIAPQKPRNSGIVEYAAKYVELLRNHTKQKIEIHRFPDEVLLCNTRIYSLKALYKHVKSQRETINKGAYDLVHMEIGNNGYLEFYFLLLLTLEKVSIPIVITFHDPPHLILQPFQYFGLNKSNTCVRVIRKAISLLLTYPLELYVIRKVNLAFILTEAGRLAACRRYSTYQSKFVVLPTFLYNKTKVQIKKENIVLGAGYWGQERGYEILLDAVNVLKRNNKELLDKWNIVLCGGILDAKSLKYYEKIIKRLREEQIEKHINTFANLSIKDFQDIFQRASIYVSTEKVTRRKNIPASSILLRAIGSGCALIVSDTPGKDEFVNNGRNGFIYQSGNMNALVNSLTKLMNSEEAVKSFQKQNEYLCDTKYDEKLVAQAFSGYYDKIKDEYISR